MSDGHSCYGTARARLDDMLRTMTPAELHRVKILSEDEDRRYSATTIDSFPQGLRSADWSTFPVRYQQAALAKRHLVTELRRSLGELTKPTDELYVSWGDFAIPSLLTTSEVVNTYAQEMIDTCSESYYSAIAEAIVIEVSHEGRFTVADVTLNVSVRAT